MKFETSDIKSIVLYNRETQNEVPCEITEKLEFKFQTEVKIPVELLKEIDTQRLNCQLMGAGIIGITLAFNVIVRADLNDFLEESFKFDEVAHLRTYSDLNYTSECKSPLVTSVKYDDGQSELESEALLLDFAEVFNEVPSLYSELFSQSQYPILIELI